MSLPAGRYSHSLARLAAIEAARGSFDAAHEDLLADDPSALVRAYAAELVGTWVRSRPAARDAITRAAAHDPSPAVRKKASWYAPGGPIYRRTRPRPA